MKPQELLWKYAEGKCGPEEKSAIEKMLAEQPELQDELDLISELNDSLSNLEAAGPSMRFSKNVMEALPPNIYPPISATSLVSPIWKKIFWGSLALFTIGVVASVLRTGLTGNALPYIDEAIEKVNNAVGGLPPVEVQFFVLTLISLLTLILIDKLFIAKSKI